jgi:hypothetical protein
MLHFLNSFAPGFIEFSIRCNQHTYWSGYAYFNLMSGAPRYLRIRIVRIRPEVHFLDTCLCKLWSFS